ncbi:hypothetical protein CK934_20580 [Chitinophaga sp. MD30]|nr:hypothetical protein CK934_20580 [Chitinophaga sp. MD30]
MLPCSAIFKGYLPDNIGIFTNVNIKKTFKTYFSFCPQKYWKMAVMLIGKGKERDADANRPK